MFRKTITVAMLAALFNLTLGGCTRNVNLHLHEVGQLTTKRIIGAGLKTGEEIYFEHHEGRYNPATKQITGMTADRERVAFRLSELRYVAIEFQNVALDDTLMHVQVDASDFASYYSSDKPPLCRSVTTKQGTTYRFARPGGHFDLTAKTVTGCKDDGGQITISLAEIDYVTVARQKKLANLAIGYVIVGSLLILLLAQAGIDWMGD